MNRKLIEMNKFGLYIVVILFLIGCGDKKSEVVTNLPENYHSRFIPHKVVQKSDEAFALTLNIKDSLYLIGDRERGKEVFLLNNETGDFCKAKTGKPQIYYEKISDIHWQLTPVIPQPDLKTRYDLVFAHNGPINFQLVSNSWVSDSSTISDIHKEIKLSGYIDTLLAYDDQFATDSIIGLKFPKVLRIDFSEDEEAIVVTYSYVDSIPGPRMIIFKDKIFPLTGPCSYQHVYPFRINNRNFIQTGSSCCECDWVIDQVFEIADDIVVLVFQDDSYSE